MKDNDKSERESKKPRSIPELHFLKQFLNTMSNATITIYAITSCLMVIVGFVLWKFGFQLVPGIDFFTIILTIILIVIFSSITILLSALLVYRLLEVKFRRRFKEEYLSKIKEKDFHDIDERKQLRKEKEEYEFKKNLKKTIKLRSMEVERIGFFDSFMWEFQPGINVLLGKNGYGKSHLMRAIVSLLDKDDNKSAEFFTYAESKAVIKLSILRDEEDTEIIRNNKFFEESIGKVPILAIPDSRFVNKSNSTIGVAGEDKVELKDNGAYHFLYQKPYEAIIQTFLYRLCIDYLDNGKSFEAQIFRLVQNIVRKLTDRSFAFHKIKQIGHASFRIEVVTEGNESNPLPIQQASQGTLSVIVIFGLIYNYLRSVFPNARDSELLGKSAIVFIDEIDEHLHPSWQQKIVGLLRKNFPNIQFVITAHSPLVVAGCLDGEVAVLRKNSKGFRVSQFQNDFIGYEPDEIYRKVFELEDKDESYYHYNTLYPQQKEIERKIMALEEKRNRSDNQERELQKLRDDLYYVGKARQRQSKRIEYEQLLRENEKLKKRLARLETQNMKKSTDDADMEHTRKKSVKSTKRKSKKRQ